MESTRKKQAPAEVSVRPAMSGGYIVRHSFDNSMAGPSYRPPEEHAFGDHASMVAHVAKYTGGTVPAGVGRPSKAKAPSARTVGAGVD